ncbi:MAG: putative sulfate/molybdate transporter [Actinomycetota bacterium]
MKIGSFEFNLHELAGSMGDFGTLLPLAIGYIAVCGLDPAGLLVMMGLANIATGLIYRLPMPIEPMKVLAIVAIAHAWSPSMVYASAFAMGIVWLVLGAAGIMKRIARVTPLSVIRGIQVSLGILLAIEAFKLINAGAAGWMIGLVSVAIVLVLRTNRYAPAALVLVAMGLLIMLFKGEFQNIAGPSFTLPRLTSFSAKEVWLALLAGGFAQIPLTATNAVIATSSLIKEYWPEREVTVRQLSLNMAVMNLVFPFFGGMPLCHGAGGLAGQYYFGARTGGTNLIEGTIEIGMGLFLAASIAAIFAAFPSGIIGAMLLMVGLELVKFARNIRWRKDLAPMATTVLVSVFTNMGYGFAAGLAVYYLQRFYFRKRNRCACGSEKHA